MKKRHSFRRRLFAGFLLASLLPLLLCSAMLLQIFRLRLDSQLEEESREQLDHVISSLDGLYRGFQQTALALQASPYVAPALSRGQRDSTTVYSELYSATEGSRLSAQFDLYDRDGVWMYSTGSGPVEPVMPTQWGVLYAARQSVGLAFTQVDGGEGNSAPLFRGAARIAGEAGEDAGYLVITLTRADFQRLLEGTYGGQSDLLLLDRYWRPVYASQTALAGRLAVQLREQLLAGEELGQEGEEYAYRAAFQEEMGLYAVLQRPQALNRDTRGLLTTVTVGSALVCVGLSVLMSLRLSRQMFYPIERLHSAIGEVVHNNLDVYVPPYQDDELGELAQRFNGMVVALKRNQEQLVENQRELNEAQIRMLQAQLNPHFLCNTLDTMKWISKINQVPQVALMSTDLADIPGRVRPPAAGGGDPPPVHGDPVHPPVGQVPPGGGHAPGAGGVPGAQDDPPAPGGKRHPPRSGRGGGRGDLGPGAQSGNPNPDHLGGGQRPGTAPGTHGTLYRPPGDLRAGPSGTV